MPTENPISHPSSSYTSQLRTCSSLNAKNPSKNVNTTSPSTSYLQHLETIAESINAWLKGGMMSTSLHGSLQAVLDCVRHERGEIERGSFDFYQIHTTKTTEPLAHLGKRKGTFDKNHTTVKVPRNSARLSAATTRPLATIASHTPLRISTSNRRKKLCKSKSTPKFTTPTCQSNLLTFPARSNEDSSHLATSETPDLPLRKRPNEDSSHLATPETPQLTVRERPNEDSSHPATPETPEVTSHRREMPPNMSALVKEINLLDPLPSTIPIGQSSDYIALRITSPCEFPLPGTYDKGELWENIDCEFISVMGADIIKRGDLRRGELGVIGVMKWMLDCRESEAWEEECDCMVVQKLTTLRDEMKKALIDSVTPSKSGKHPSPPTATTSVPSPTSNPSTTGTNVLDPTATPSTISSSGSDKTLFSTFRSSDDSNHTTLIDLEVEEVDREAIKAFDRVFEGGGFLGTASTNEASDDDDDVLKSLYSIPNPQDSTSSALVSSYTQPLTTKDTAAAHEPLTSDVFWLQKIPLYQCESVRKQAIIPAELVEIHRAISVLLRTLVRGCESAFDPLEVLTKPVTFSSLGEPGIRIWCQRVKNRELFTTGKESIWYKPNNFNFNSISKSAAPENIPIHERYLWDTYKMFHSPTPIFLERAMHFVLAALVLIGSDANKNLLPTRLPPSTPLSLDSRSAIMCWTHYKKLSSARWKAIQDNQRNSLDGCIQNLDRLIASIYTMVETFASIWACTTLDSDIAKYDQLINQATSAEMVENLTQRQDKLLKARRDVNIVYANLPPLVSFLCAGVKGLMVHPTDRNSFTTLRALNFLLVTSHLAKPDAAFSEPVWKRTQSYLVEFFKEVILTTENWEPRELNRFHLAKALFLDFSDFWIARDTYKILVPTSRTYKIADQEFI